jgi:toxin ParE1/3/4
MTGYALHPKVFQELDEIRGYIAQDSPDAADRMIDEILDAVAALVPFPHRGIRRADLTSRPLRIVWVREYLIAYATDRQPLLVVAVIHGRRSPRVMAAILRNRK